MFYIYFFEEKVGVNSYWELTAIKIVLELAHKGYNYIKVWIRSTLDSHFLFPKKRSYRLENLNIIEYKSSKEMFNKSN